VGGQVKEGLMQVPQQVQIIRAQMVAACQEMNRTGLNQGTSGNLSVRVDGSMLITPTATPYDQLAPDMMASVRIGDEEGRFTGPRAPSSEWRFHRDIYRARADVGAIVHAHAPYATALSMLRKPLPAAHYMIAAFNTHEIICTDYAPYGTAELSALAVAGLGKAHGVLLGSHGLIAVGETLERAMWRAHELETIVRQYMLACQLGDPVILPKTEIEALIPRFAAYGMTI
jgi:L-fuculose-phosphate aldolase